MLSVLVLLAAGPSNDFAPLIERRSAKPLVEFSACFAEAEDSRGRAWAYAPSKNGGTFTDFGAHGAPATYWLQVRAAAGGTDTRLVATAPSPVAKSVEQCR